MERRQRPKKVLVGFSGGKDSQVVLDRCRRSFPHVEAFFWYLVEGLECQERFLRREEAQGLKIHRLPRPELVASLRFGNYRIHNDRTDQLPTVKYVDLEAIVRERTGIEWIAYGHRMSDSLERRAMLHKIGPVDHKGKRLYPIWNWSTDQVRSYLKQHRLPSPPVIGGVRMGDVALNEKSMRYLRDHWPKDYAKVLEVFPLAGAILARAELRETAWAEKEETPPADGPDGDPVLEDGSEV